MKVAWIFPQHKMCGISFYSHAYVEALKPLVEVACFDPGDFSGNPIDTINRLNQCDLVHIQYETSFFFKNNKDFYSDLCSSIRPPLIVTLHEIYERFPGVFPRDAITGVLPLRKLKLWLYDLRHPHVTALTRHTRRRFSSRALLVHSRFQKDILTSKGISPDMVSVFPIPVNSTTTRPAHPWDGSGSINLASTGFISGSFDYELLFQALDQCDLPWLFTWIGGIRRPEDNRLLQNLHQEISRRNWRDRFRITGAIPTDKRDELLSRTHIYCAFFNYKSSSESLATAIGNRTLILATSLPLTREMSEQFPVMALTPPDPAKAAQAIRQVAADSKTQNYLQKALSDYCHEYGRQRMARRLVSFYEKEAGL